MTVRLNETHDLSIGIALLWKNAEYLKQSRISRRKL